MCSLILCLTLAWQSVSPELQKHIQAGVAAQQQGRHDDAIAEFKKVAELAPRLPAAFVNLGNAYMRKGDYVSAIEPLKQALGMNPELIGAQQLLGYALLSAGFAAEAIPHLEKTKSTDVLGIAMVKTGRYAEAIANLQIALEKHPGDPDLLYYLGRASGMLSKQTFDTLQSAQPESARAHQVMGEALAAFRNVPGAEKQYQEALKIRPDTPGVHLGLGELYAAAGQWDKAEAEYRAEARLQPGDAEAAFRLGAALLEQGKIKEARQELERSHRLAPGAADTLYSLGKAAQLDGDKASAEKAWLELVAIDNESKLAAQAQFGLAGLYRSKGEVAKADAAMREFRRIQQRNKQ